MRQTERKVAYPNCDKQGSITQVNYIEIKDKKLAEEKLCQLEDIEEKLGIELTIVFEALINGIWIKDKAKKCRPCYLSASFGSMQLTNAGIRYSTISTNKYLYFKDYGKTWALTKEELENDK